MFTKEDIQGIVFSAIEWSVEISSNDILLSDTPDTLLITDNDDSQIKIHLWGEFYYGHDLDIDLENESWENVEELIEVVYDRVKLIEEEE